MKRRPYQQQQLECTKRDADAGIRQLLLVAATGVGKTEYAAALPQHLGLQGQYMFLVHRDELSQQAAKKIQLRNPDLKVSIEMGDKVADVDSDVVVASVQTLGREGSDRIKRFDPDKVKLMVTDECHRSVSQTYLTIYDYFEMLSGRTDKLLIGITATPGRADGQALAKVYKKITHHYGIRQAIEDGYLVDIVPVRLKTGTDLTQIKTTAGDFAQGELSNAINTPERNQKVVKAWLEHGRGRSTIAFAADVAHAKSLSDMFEHYGVKSAAIWAGDKERADKIELLRRGQLEVLNNVGILTEGFDMWEIACVVMARPTKSQVLFSQCIGRGTRIPEGIDNLNDALAQGLYVPKRDCIVIDCADTTARNSLVSIPSLFGLPAEIDLRGKSAIKAVKLLEEAQLAYPEVDFSTLQSLDDIDAVVEKVNDLWQIKWDDSVLTNSTLSWHRVFDGSFVLTLPNEPGVIPPRNEKVTISENTLGSWEIAATIDGVKYKGVRDTLDQAFAAGDSLVMERAQNAVRVLVREADWHDEAITDAQTRMLKRLMKNQPIPPGITKGNASKLISKLMAAKIVNSVRTT